MESIIQIDIADYKSKLRILSEDAETLKANTGTSEFLTKTNINPFLKDLAQYTEAIDLLKNYKKILSEDIQEFNKVAENFREQDVLLSQMSNEIK